MPLVVTAHDITEAIVRIDAAAKGLDGVFQQCAAKMHPETITAWNAWYDGWKTWANDNKDLGYLTLGLPQIGNQAVGYEADIAGWQAVANRDCKADIPILQSQPDVAGRNTDVPQSWITFAKWTAVAVVALVAVPPLVRGVEALGTAAKAKRALSAKRGDATREDRAKTNAEVNAWIQRYRRNHGRYPSYDELDQRFGMVRRA